MILSAVPGGTAHRCTRKFGGFQANSSYSLRGKALSRGSTFNARHTELCPPRRIQLLVNHVCLLLEKDPARGLRDHISRMLRTVAPAQQLHLRACATHQSGTHSLFFLTNTEILINVHLTTICLRGVDGSASRNTDIFMSQPFVCVVSTALPHKYHNIPVITTSSCGFDLFPLPDCSFVQGGLSVRTMDNLRLRVSRRRTHPGFPPTSPIC